ncbi:MAG: hypothetical protein Q9183_000110 [Haloplaca sp. 2 TL-2023]
MEGDERQRRQYDQQQYPRTFAPGFRSNAPESNAAERLRQAQMMTGSRPTSGPIIAAPGAHSQELGGFGYPQGTHYPPTQMQGSPLQFSSEYEPEVQRSQNFPSYTPQMMYNVPQQPQPRSPYESMPQYQPRQTAAMEGLSNQFGVSTQYYAPSEPSAASGQASPQRQYPPTHYQQALAYQTPGTGRHPIPASYPAGMAEYSPASMPDASELQEQPSTDFEADYGRYQEGLKKTLENASKGRLAEAGHLLLEVSEWLLGRAKVLGLFMVDAAIRKTPG